MTTRVIFNADNLPEIGDSVIDEEGNIGTVTEADNIHNIRVQYTECGGFGLYCLDPTCIAEYSPLWSQTP